MPVYGDSNLTFGSGLGRLGGSSLSLRRACRPSPLSVVWCGNNGDNAATAAAAIVMGCCAARARSISNRSKFGAGQFAIWAARPLNTQTSRATGEGRGTRRTPQAIYYACVCTYMCICRRIYISHQSPRSRVDATCVSIRVVWWSYNK